MKATGIVRRIDDLGRVVIPKEIRRQMKIREGDPLEIFTDNGVVCFARYNPYNTEIWAKATAIAKVMLKHKFVLLNRYGEVMGDNCKRDKVVIDSLNYSKQIIIDGEVEGFVMALQDEADFEKIAEVAKVIEALFAEEG